MSALRMLRGAIHRQCSVSSRLVVPTAEGLALRAREIVSHTQSLDPELADGQVQRLNLYPQTVRRGRRLLDQGGVLL